MAASNGPAVTLKLTLVGDGSIGKSCLILQYLYGDVIIFLIELFLIINANLIFYLVCWRI